MNSVVYLLEHPFQRLTYEQKIEVKALGRPTPDLKLETKQSVKGKQVVRKFKPEFYTKFSWICGCPAKNALYCFPCLLFGGDESWTKNGVIDLIHIAAKTKKHETSRVHINNIFSLSVLGKLNIRTQLSSQYREALLKKNEEVRKNRYILSKIINCIRFCGAFELALRGHDETENSENKGIFRELLDFSAELDRILKDHLEKASIFKGTSKTIQNDLLECMLEIYHQEVHKEVRSADYVALISDETTDVSCQFQLVVLLRYIVNGLPVERFYTFLNPAGHDAKSLSASILSIIDPLLADNPNKLVAQSFDGAAVMSGSVNGVQKIIKDKYPYANFVHCYAHQANLVLAKATSVNKNVRIFFSDLTGLCAFFSNSPQRTNILEEVAQRRLPRAVQTRWNFQSRGINTVYEIRHELIDVMNTIQSDLKLQSTIQQATAYKRLLEDQDFLYWLSVFHKIMPHVDILFKQLQKKITDPVKVKSDIQAFHKQIEKIRSDIADDNVPELQSNLDASPCTASTKRRRCDCDNTGGRKREALEVCDIIVSSLTDRFTFTGHLVASNLFVAEKFTEYRRSFPEAFLKTTAECYPFLNVSSLKTELQVLYERDELTELSGAAPFLSLILSDGLDSTFPEITKLLKILITIPMSTSEAERCFSMLKRVKTFLRNTMSEERLTALGMLSFEKHFINSIDDFNNRVIDLFAEKKNRRIDLIVKAV